MSPRTSDKYQEIRELARQKIMDTALELFANEGYYPTSISDIAKSAGISKGLMYNYFESKEVLLKEIIFTGINNLAEEFDPNRDGILTHEELIHFIRQSFKLVKEHTTYWKLYFMVMYQPPVLSLFEKELQDFLGYYLKMIDQYFAKQKVKNPLAESRLFSSVMDGIFMNYVMSPETFPIDEIEERVVKMYQ
jgi:AcrR family transcriptional regulator